MPEAWQQLKQDAIVRGGLTQKSQERGGKVLASAGCGIILPCLHSYPWAIAPYAGSRASTGSGGPQLLPSLCMVHLDENCR